MKFPHADILLQIGYVAIAAAGGVAKYAQQYLEGKPFSFSVLVATVFVAAFSGWTFGTFGAAMSLPTGICFVMAALGSLFSEKAMALLMDWMGNRIK